MDYIKEKYIVFYKDSQVGMYYIYEDGKASYDTYSIPDEFSDELKALGLDKSTSGKRKLSLFKKIINDENLVSGTLKQIYQSGFIKIERIPKDVDKFMIYQRSAKKGEAAYSAKDYSVPHMEGGRLIEGMDEWASWYCINKKDNGMYEAELDEAWYGGSGHYDGGTICTEVPEEWLLLPYDDFLKHLVTLSAASHYGFTADDLKEKKGLKEFLGF